MSVLYFFFLLNYRMGGLALPIEKAIPLSSEICFTPTSHESLVVSEGSVVVSLEVSISSLSSSVRRQDKLLCYTNVTLCTICYHRLLEQHSIFPLYIPSFTKRVNFSCLPSSAIDQVLILH